MNNEDFVSFNSVQYLSYMYKPIVPLKESRGFYLPLVALRCQGEQSGSLFTYQPSCESL